MPRDVLVYPTADNSLRCGGTPCTGGHVLCRILRFARCPLLLYYHYRYRLRSAVPHCSGLAVTNAYVSLTDTNHSRLLLVCAIYSYVVAVTDSRRYLRLVAADWRPSARTSRCSDGSPPWPQYCLAFCAPIHGSDAVVPVASFYCMVPQPSPDAALLPVWTGLPRADIGVLFSLILAFVSVTPALLYSAGTWIDV